MNKTAKALEESGKFSIHEDLRAVMAQYPDLDIYAPVGTKVRPVFYKGEPYHGSNYDKENVAKHLKEDGIYTIDSMEVGNWSTDVYLVEVPNVRFNSVCLSPTPTTK